MFRIIATDELGPIMGALTLLALGLVITLILVARARARHIETENARLRRFAETTFEGMLVLEGGQVADANTALCAIIGCQPSDLIGRPVAALFATDGRDVLAMLRRSADGGSLDRALNLDLLDMGGQPHPVQLLARSLAAGHGGPLVVAVREPPTRHTTAQRVQNLAHTDPLTGLANRFLMQERLAKALADAEAAKTAVAVLSLDLDHLQEINDTVGQQGGDAVIVEVADRLRDAVRANDTVARVGGDDFVIVAPLPRGPDGARLLAERIIRVIAAPIAVGSHKVIITASLGIALYPTGATAADLLLKQADMARNRAKQEDRGGYRCFIPVMDTDLPERRQMAESLRTAVENEEFILHYQPMFNAETLSVVSYEALLRWKRPLGGFVAPGQFIPVAEACGAMLEIGQWALESACAEAATWPQRHGVSLNLSLVQLQDADLPSRVADILARTGLPASRLELEVSERLLIGEATQVINVMRGLQALGIRIALDDFGSGTASLRHLTCFPFDRVKIHRSFVIDLGVDPNAEAIVSAVLGMARDAGLNVTAAGVETEQQLAMLRNMRCNHLQGFLLGRPAPASKIVNRAPSYLAPA